MTDPISVGAILKLGEMAINKIWPDKTKRAEEMRKLRELEQRGDLAELNAHVQLLLAQIDLNKTEAQSGSLFIAGWRPFIGWAGGFALAYAGIIYPLLTWFWALAQGMGWIPKELSPPPFVESATLGAIVTGMLGIGGMRSYDKRGNVQTDRLE